MWNFVLVYLEIVLTLTQDRCMVCAEHTVAQKSFLTHPIELLGDMGHLESRFGLFGDVVVSSKIGARFTPNIP
jgi:hypothetical protein